MPRKCLENAEALRMQSISVTRSYTTSFESWGSVLQNSLDTNLKL
jgi:hypothetical protein